MERAGQDPGEFRPVGEATDTRAAAEQAKVAAARESGMESSRTDGMALAAEATDEPLTVEAVNPEPLDDRGRTPAERARRREEIIDLFRLPPAERRRRAAASSPSMRARLGRMAWRQTARPKSPQ